MSGTLIKKTLEEHREYLHEIVKLKLCFAWNWGKNHPDENFPDILRNRIDIYRKTAINRDLMNPEKTNFNDSEWVQIENRLYDLYKKCKNDITADNFENCGFEIVKYTIDARCKRDYGERPYVLDYKCGSLTFDPPGEFSPELVGIHIANAIAPKSIFEDKLYLSKCLISVIEKSSALYPKVIGISTSSWLNSHPLWLRNFPDSWINNRKEDTDIKWHFGFWGQFITARGTFNKKLGEQLRKTDKMPFKTFYSSCSFNELIEHLKKISV